MTFLSINDNNQKAAKLYWCTLHFSWVNEWISIRRKVGSRMTSNWHTSDKLQKLLSLSTQGIKHKKKSTKNTVFYKYKQERKHVMCWFPGFCCFSINLSFVLYIDYHWRSNINEWNKQFQLILWHEVNNWGRFCLFVILSDVEIIFDASISI